MSFLAHAWYRRAAWLQLLRPLSWIFGHLAARRREHYASGRQSIYRPPVPVIVVGNIAVGGTGKTPLVIELARLLQTAGYRPGIVSRGYGAEPGDFPRAVSAASDAREAGDEPLLLARNTGVPVVIAPDRGAAVRRLLRDHPVDVILSDDGLQHYALARDIEICVVDGQRGLGNGLLLPAGPLREAPARLRQVDLVVSNGPLAAALPVPSHVMRLQAEALYNLNTGERRELRGTGKAGAGGQTVHAVAGIGNPQRFFSSLSALGFAIIPHAFSDHHRFSAADIAFADGHDILMTEKDAVKCLGFANERCWYLKVQVRLGEDFRAEVLGRLASVSRSVLSD